MKILFICGSIENGKDGVGDYTMKLSGELICQGIEIGVLAYKDGFVSNVKEVNQKIGETSLSCLRLPENLTSNERVKISRDWINSRNPEWISLQFVPYSFHLKGLPFSLSKELKKIGSNRKWHIMFHELWLGLRDTDPIKFKIIGFLQRQIVISLKKKLKFNVVHTHTKFYINELTRMNFKPKYLPIFSNIKFSSTNHNDQPIIDKNNIIFVHFGSIHPNVPIKEFAFDLNLYSKNKENKNITLVLLGRSGVELANWEKELKKYKVSYQVLGELPNEEVSYILQKADYGITTNPVFVLEKSGTVAAMEEHNLPILVVSENTRPKDGTEIILEDNFFHYRSGNLFDFIHLKRNNFNKKVKGIREISDKFLNDLLLL